MTHPDDLVFGDDAPEADAAEQRILVDDGDEESGLDAARVNTARDWDASEADLIDQAIAIPFSDDGGFDR